MNWTLRMSWSFFFGLVAGSGLYAAVRWIYNRRLRDEKSFEDESDCFFFSPHNLMLRCIRKQSSPCKTQSCPPCNFKRYLSIIKNAKTHLDVCVYVITSQDLAKALINLSNRGVFVRIIVDKEMADQACNSKVCVFAKEHIPTKIISSNDIMHNKFAIVDQKMVLTGSLNWTKQATSGNFENAVLIQNPKIVKKFRIYFDSIWFS